MSWKTLTINSDLYTYEYFLREYVCRICWCQNGVKEITSKLSEGVETNVTIAEVIFECIGVDLTINERPTKICSSCWNEVENFSEFKSFCLTTQSKLYEILREGSQQQTELDHSYEDCKSIGDYAPSEANEFSNFELATINLFEDSNKESNLKESQSQVKKTKKVKKIRSETYCSQCKLDLGCQDLFSQHNKDIHRFENGLFKCLGCDRAFKQRKRCLRHETEYCKALKNGYKCDICGKVLQKRGSLERHLMVHRENNVDFPEELIKCKKCARQFHSMESLNEHRIIHEKDRKNWVCDTCGRVFMRRDYLYKHKLMHEGLKQHVCPHCDFRTIQKSSLNVHIRKHTGERPYACSLCPQRCVNSSNLREHMKRHLGIKHFQCKLCDKKFGYKISLQEHISSIHERSEVHSCSDCGATYSRFRGLRRHLSAKHGKQLKKTKAEEPVKTQPEKIPFETKESELLMEKNIDGSVFSCS